MNHLSGLDATFLHLETPEMPMHVGSLNVLELPKGYQGDFYEDAKKFMASRIHLADVFTRKLALMPFDISNPVWVNDDDIDIDYHVRHISLPKPGTNRQLQQYVARLHSTLMDRSRPLWEFFIIDGLQSGEVALYSKVHHAGIDGQAGVALGKAIFDTVAEGRAVRPPRVRPRNNYQLGMAELAAAALRNTAQQYIKVFKMAPAIARAIASLAKPKEKGVANQLKGAPRKFRLFAPRTPFNVSITNQRSFAGRTIPVAETKALAKHFGVSLNDVVLGTVAGAVRRYLQESNELPAKSLVAGVPVSLREAGDETANNQASFMLVSLATEIKDPLERLKAINASSSRAKSTVNRFKSVILDDFPMFAAPWLVSGMASTLGRSGLVNVLPPLVNVTISNVAGAPVPIYFAGALMTSYYPVSIVAHGAALNVTVQSYNGRMDYGLIGCNRAVPDVTAIGDHLLTEHKILMALMASSPPEGVSTAPDAKPMPVAAAKKPVVAKPIARKPVAPIKRAAAQKAPEKKTATTATKAQAKAPAVRAVATKKTNPKPAAAKKAAAKKPVERAQPAKRVAKPTKAAATPAAATK